MYWCWREFCSSLRNARGQRALLQDAANRQSTTAVPMSIGTMDFTRPVEEAAVGVEAEVTLAEGPGNLSLRSKFGK